MTTTNLALVLEYAQGGSLTNYVSARWQHAQHLGSFLSEDEARYLFRVRRACSLQACWSACRAHCGLAQQVATEDSVPARMRWLLTGCLACCTQPAARQCS